MERRLDPIERDEAAELLRRMAQLARRVGGRWRATGLGHNLAEELNEMVERLAQRREA
jgi:hypothetical protein